MPRLFHVIFSALIITVVASAVTLLIGSAPSPLPVAAQVLMYAIGGMFAMGFCLIASPE
jgi:hypothetical protein